MQKRKQFVRGRDRGRGRGRLARENYSASRKETIGLESILTPFCLTREFLPTDGRIENRTGNNLKEKCR